jgi:hypothetical protein
VSLGFWGFLWWESRGWMALCYFGMDELLVYQFISLSEVGRVVSMLEFEYWGWYREEVGVHHWYWDRDWHSSIMLGCRGFSSEKRLFLSNTRAQMRNHKLANLGKRGRLRTGAEIHWPNALSNNGSSVVEAEKSKRI